MKTTGDRRNSSPHRGLAAWFVFVNGFATISLLAVLAMVWHVPLVFPSLGPTAFLLFSSPHLPSACPRNTLCGHAIGIVCGYGALWLTGLQHAPSAMLEGKRRPGHCCCGLAGAHRRADAFVRRRSFAGWCHHIDHLTGNHYAAAAPAGDRSGSRAYRHPGGPNIPTVRYRFSTVVATNPALMRIQTGRWTLA